jgi:hypothetical protein
LRLVVIAGVAALAALSARRIAARRALARGEGVADLTALDAA